MLGLQAMSEYGSVMSGNLDLNIGITSGNFTQNLHVGKSDAMVLKLVEVWFVLHFFTLQIRKCVGAMMFSC